MNTHSNPERSKRTIANRLNAQKSTGPKTAEGKTKSSQNALKHGLTAAKHVETVFDQPGHFEAFQQDLLDHFTPRSAYEAILVDRIITLMWRLRRIPVIEAQIMDGKVENTRLHPSMAYIKSGGALEFLHLSRYEANLNRCLRQTMKDLADARNQTGPIVNGQSSMVDSRNEPIEHDATDTDRQSPAADSHSLIANREAHETNPTNRNVPLHFKRTG